jgi:hypothetical protein
MSSGTDDLDNVDEATEPQSLILWEENDYSDLEASEAPIINYDWDQDGGDNLYYPATPSRKYSEDEAATIIQKLSRGFLAKKLSRVMRAARHRQKIQLRYQDKDELFRFYFEQVGAALIIQVSW